MAAICEEFEDHQDRSGQPVILVGQSIVLGEVGAETLVHDEDPRNVKKIRQQNIQQIESLSPENRVSGQGDIVPKACSQQAAVCASTFSVFGMAHAGEKG